MILHQVTSTSQESYVHPGTRSRGRCESGRVGISIAYILARYQTYTFVPQSHPLASYTHYPKALIIIRSILSSYHALPHLFSSCIPLHHLTGSSPILNTRQRSSTANDLENGECAPVTVIFARDTTEDGNIGTIVGPPLQSALQSTLGAGIWRSRVSTIRLM